MWIWMAAFAGELDIQPDRYRVDGTFLEVGDVRLTASGYGYRIVDGEQCRGIAIEGPSSAQLPTDLLRSETWHEVDQILLFDPSACDLLVLEQPIEEEADDVVVVESRKRDRSLRLLRRSLKDRSARLHDWGLGPDLLQEGQRLAEVRHADGTGRVEADGATGWSTLIDDPYQQVEFGVGHLALESSDRGAPRPVHRRPSARRGVLAEQALLNLEVTDFSFTHKAHFHAQLQLRCTEGPCSHVSVLVPVTYEEQTSIATFAEEFALAAVRVNGADVVAQPSAFGRSAAHAPFAYRPYTVPLALDTNSTAMLELEWDDRFFLSHPIPSPQFSSMMEVTAYIDWHRTHPGPERTVPLDLSREATLDSFHATIDQGAADPGIKWIEGGRDVGMRPRTVMPVVIGQAAAPPSEARLIRPSTGMPVWLHGSTVETREGRLQIATSQSGGPWIGAGRYKEPFEESGMTLYLSTPFLRPKAPEVTSRVRALHEIFSAQLGVRPLDLALFEGPGTSGMRPTYGAASGLAWLRPVQIPTGQTSDGNGDPDSVKKANRLNYTHAEDRALIYAVSKQWFDRPTATLEPWLQGALTELYADLVFEAVHGAASATPWRRRPDKLKQAAFADFGINDWSPAQQVTYATRALELVRTSVGKKFFNTAVRNMLKNEAALSADLLAKHFVQERDQRLVRDALIRGICPTVTAEWSQDRFQRGKVELTTDYTEAPIVVPVVIEGRGVSQQHFVKFENGKGELDLSSRVKIKRVHIDPYQRLPLCHTEVHERT